MRATPPSPSSPSASALTPLLERLGVERVLEALASLSAPSGLFVVNERGDIVFWSEGCERLLGFKAAEIKGKSGLQGPDLPGEKPSLRAVGLSRLRSEREKRVQTVDANGQPITVRRVSHPLFDAEGRFEGGMVLLEPISAESGPEFPSLVSDQVSFHGLVTRDPAMLRVIQVIRNVAETDATVLVRGESGAGKELVARALHLESHRRHGPFVAVNCGALTPSLLESELFGHVKGAFTGASSDRAGIFVQANHGTLFLDEVAELPLELQPKLLRVLQERTVLPVGSNRPIEVDVRVVAATHRALRDEVKAGRFREDLMYRLRVVPLFLPTLRQRPADVELLLHHFIEEANKRGPRRVQGIAPEVMRSLMAHAWPGNVRELHNVVDYAFAVGRGPIILLEELPPELRTISVDVNPWIETKGNERTVQQFPVKVSRGIDSTAPSVNPASESQVPSISHEIDAQRLRQAILNAQGNLNTAAQALGLSRTTFWRLRRKFKLDSDTE